MKVLEMKLILAKRFVEGKIDEKANNAKSITAMIALVAMQRLEYQFK